MVRSRTYVLVGVALLMLAVGAGIGAFVLGRANRPQSAPANGQGNVPTYEKEPWTEVELTLEGAKKVLEYQRFREPIKIKAEQAKEFARRDTAIGLVVSSMSCIQDGGTLDDWANHYIDPEGGKKMITTKDMTPQEWIERTRKKSWEVAVLGQIRYSKYTIVVLRMKIVRPNARWLCVGVPTVERDGIYYRDAEADECWEPVLRWLSENEYPMITGATKDG